MSELPNRAIPRRDSAAGSRRVAAVSVLTPAPRASEPVEPPSVRPRNRVAAATAILSVGLLIGAVAFPTVATNTAAMRGGGAEEVAAAQRLPGPVLPEAPTLLDAVGSVALEAEPLPEPTGARATAVPDVSGSDLRLPFDREWPLTDGFGYRSAPVTGFHDAQDIAAAGGTPVLAVATGTVSEAGWASDGCGFSAKLTHSVDGQELTSRYCHMEAGSHALQVGDTVAAGAQVGLVGNTGLSFGAHLHLALRLAGQPIDPLPYLRR